MSRSSKEIMDSISRGPLHVTLIDPDKQGPERVAEMVRSAQDGGSDLILVGGTTGVDYAKLDATLDVVRESSDLPIMIFPACAENISEKADAIFYMSLMNSRNVRFVMREAVNSSVRLAGMSIDILSVGYIVVDPGMLVGEVGEVDLIERHDPERAKSYAKACELFGMDFCYLEGGSGVKEPIPPKMISAVRSVIGIPLIVGGGINSPERAGLAVEAGADIIVTGTMVEVERDPAGMIRSTKKEMSSAWERRMKGG